ncbi:MAG: helix-turn-helix transcriptional regulator [Lachnospiraceae bacterium]|nr:helix-turn-helix transcriptional regulator [Lachnospiraceae bacterium]MDD3616446.1 helix-turn-helix transcriptional regulator [Lachnospiraceae bacterium]
MKQIETSDFMVLNNIIYKVYTTKDLTEMRENLLEQLKMVLDFDSADFFLADTVHHKGLVEPVTFNCDGNRVAQMDEEDYSRGIMYSGKSIVYRETDIISDEKRVKTQYYQAIYRPNNWHYSLQMILGKDKEFLGVITFYRTIGKDNFSYDDIFMLDMLKDHLSYRLWEVHEVEEKSAGKLTVSQAAEQYHLTKREHTILRKLMDGQENDDICVDLSISVNTLKKHILNIYRKLEINNRVQLFKMVRERE